MYVMNISVGELKADLHYNDFEEALVEFKDCVLEVFQNPRFKGDDMIMKINADYALLMIQSGNDCYKIELKNEEE